jgi:hypothetical protein
MKGEVKVQAAARVVARGNHVRGYSGVVVIEDEDGFFEWWCEHRYQHPTTNEARLCARRAIRKGLVMTNKAKTPVMTVVYSERIPSTELRHLTLGDIEDLCDKIGAVGRAFFTGVYIDMTVEGADLWELRETLADLEDEMFSHGLAWSAKRDFVKELT